VKALLNPRVTPQTTWSIPWRRAEVGGMNGHGNAHGIAAAQSVLANGGAYGKKLLSDAGREQVLRTQADGVDLVLGIPLRWGHGLRPVLADGNELRTPLRLLGRQRRITVLCGSGRADVGRLRPEQVGPRRARKRPRLQAHGRRLRRAPSEMKGLAAPGHFNDLDARMTVAVHHERPHRRRIRPAEHRPRERRLRLLGPHRPTIFLKSRRAERPSGPPPGR
jgi:hypothetical protein